MANNRQFESINKLFDEFYNIAEPKYEALDDYAELKKKLKKANVLNVNVIEDETVKIMKESNG